MALRIARIDIISPAHSERVIFELTDNVYISDRSSRQMDLLRDGYTRPRADIVSSLAITSGVALVTLKGDMYTPPELYNRLGSELLDYLLTATRPALKLPGKVIGLR